MNDLRTAAQQALDWLYDNDVVHPTKVSEDLRAALAQQAEPVEPVAYIHRQGNYWDTSERHLTDDEKARGWTEEPLYTAPPQRLPLTEEEIDKIFKHLCNTVGASYKTMTRAVEQAHGIKE